MKKIIFALLMITSLFAYADTTSNAQLPTYYQVDIILFKNLQSLQTLSPDLWKAYKNPDFNNAISLTNSSSIEPIDQNQLELFKLLAPNQFTLNAEANRIKHSKLFQFVSQQSWLQPITSQNDKLMIIGGTNFTTNSYNPVWEVAGTIQLKSSLYQYLILNVNLALNEPNSFSNGSQSIASDNPNFHSLPLQETRRIKTDQLNYLDSPGLGLLIKVTKVQKPSA